MIRTSPEEYFNKLLEALRRDPPRVTLQLTAQGAEKLRHSFLHGAPVGLGRDELLGFKSSFDFLMSDEEYQGNYELTLAPTFRTVRESFRITFAGEAQRVIYDLVEFAISAKAVDVDKEIQRVVTFSSVSTHIPFKMQIEFGLDGTQSRFEVERRFQGHNVLNVQKFFEGLAALKSAGQVELYDLKKQKPLGVIHVALTSISDDWWTNERFNSHLVEIATVFGESLTIPEVITNTDLETMAFLLEVCRHGEVKRGTVNNLTANLVKSDKPDEELFAPLSGEFMVGLVNDEYPPQRLLGTDVSVGPCRIIIERAMLVDLDETKDKYRALEPGESLTVSFRTIGPVRQVFPRFYKGEQMFPLSEIQDSGTYKEVGCINDKQNDDSQHSKTAGHHGFGPMFWALTLGGQPSDGPRAADRGIPRFDWHEAGCVRQSWLRRTYGH